jgi:hypothetical protein
MHGPTKSNARRKRVLKRLAKKASRKMGQAGRAGRVKFSRHADAFGTCVN